MYLFFDTETTGLPQSWKAPVTDLDNWPRVVQLAWELRNPAGELVEAGNDIIFPDGYTISDGSAAIHRITTDRAKAEGKPLKSVMDKFSQLLDLKPIVVAHNYSFDSTVMGAEFLRLGQANPFPKAKHYCTMLSSTKFVNIPGKYGPKYPTLQELHTKLFGGGFSEAHDAAVDIAITAKCFFELQKVM